MSDRTDEIKQNNPEPVNIVEAVRRAEPFTVFIVSDDESDGIFPAEDYDTEKKLIDDLLANRFILKHKIK